MFTITFEDNDYNLPKSIEKKYRKNGDFTDFITLILIADSITPVQKQKIFMKLDVVNESEIDLLYQYIKKRRERLTSFSQEDIKALQEPLRAFIS